VLLSALVEAKSGTKRQLLLPARLLSSLLLSALVGAENGIKTGVVVAGAPTDRLCAGGTILGAKLSVESYIS